MKPRYERPFIVRHGVTTWSKGGALGAPSTLSSFEGLPVSELVQRYGSPLFVLAEREIRERVRELSRELERRFSDSTVAWSYKTNYLDAVCSIMHSEGAWAEVVSGMELEKALRLGVPGHEIIFNGPGKSAADLERAFGVGARVHIDHLDELTLAEHVATKLELEPEVGIRVNLSGLPVAAWDRFGFNLENGSALHAIHRIQRGRRLKFRALHCHIGTFILDADAYRLAARKVGEFAHKLGSAEGVVLDSLDFGGFASHNTLHQQYLPGREVAPSLGQYVEKIATGLAEGLDGSDPPRVVLETGRALIDDAGALLSSVIGTKRLTDGRRAVILDAGVNILPTAFWYRHDVHPAQETRGIPEPTVLLGPLCMAIDVVREMMLPPVKAGDRVVINRVGAYNMTQWMQFIMSRPNVVLVSPQGEQAVIRRAESLETLTAQEQVPEWLRAS
jgi:diaminopimelate decarboxylase